MTLMVAGKAPDGSEVPIKVSADGTVATSGGGGGGGGGSSDTTEATQLLVKAAVEAINTATGTVTASPTANTVLARLKDLLTGIALATGTNTIGKVDINAGANVVGKVGIDQTTPGTTDSVSVKSSAATSGGDITRPANTTAYTAGDVVGATAAAITFSAIGTASKPLLITDATLRLDVASIPSGMTSFRLHLYSVTPPSALADNAVWDLPSGDRASYLGYIDLGAPVDVGSTLYVQQSGVNKLITLGASTSLFGYLVTNGAYTPSSAAVHNVTLSAISV